MGNALGCAGLGERLAAAARDGDAAEVRRLLAVDPGLARCTATFGNLSSPLHLAATKGHHEVRTCTCPRARAGRLDGRTTRSLDGSYVSSGISTPATAARSCLPACMLDAYEFVSVLHGLVQRVQFKFKTMQRARA